MIVRIVLAALVAGLLAGIVLAGMQHARLSPLIAQAEHYETAATAAIADAQKPCVENMPGMKMCSDDHPVWQPKIGLEKTLYTSVTSLLTGAGFAVLLLGISLLANIPITKRNGLIWGLCGFLAVALAPAAGLPPNPPAMPIAELMPRQIWWAGTAVETAIGIYLITLRPERWAKFIAIIFFMLPHVIGAPQAADTTTLLPAHIAATFVANAIAAAAIFWSVLGFALGQLLDKYQKDISQL
jgi:cobalt transporter subunit CbtA